MFNPTVEQRTQTRGDVRSLRERTPPLRLHGLRIVEIVFDPRGRNSNRKRLISRSLAITLRHQHIDELLEELA